MCDQKNTLNQEVFNADKVRSTEKLHPYMLSLGKTEG